MYVSFLFVDLSSLSFATIFFFPLLLRSHPNPPSSCYLLTPADLGSNNGRAGKADEVMWMGNSPLNRAMQ